MASWPIYNPRVTKIKFTRWQIYGTTKQGWDLSWIHVIILKFSELWCSLNSIFVAVTLLSQVTNVFGSPKTLFKLADPAGGPAWMHILQITLNTYKHLRPVWSLINFFFFMLDSNNLVFFRIGQFISNLYNFSGWL